MMNNAVLDAIFSRHSTRKFTAQAVETTTLEVLLQAAMAAPSACNNQPWEFVVITEPRRLEQVWDHTGYHAPAAVVVCGNSQTDTAPECRQFWVQDCSAALENMLIAAVGLGLGAVWVGVYPVEESIKKARALAGLPEHIVPLAIVCIGYAEESHPIQAHYEASRVHWQLYGGNR